MKTTKNTILISGGTAGIGLEIAKLAAANGNKVIITGRTQKRLDKALSLIPDAIGILSDVSKKEDTEALVKKLYAEFPDLNLVINNAGHATLYDVGASDNAFENAEAEMLTN